MSKGLSEKEREMNKAFAELNDETYVEDQDEIKRKMKNASKLINVAANICNRLID